MSMNEKDLYYAVREAINSGTSVKDFILRAQELWAQELHDKMNYDMREFNRILKERM